MSKGNPVDWWFVFKLNTESFPGCGSAATRLCLFGGTVQAYPEFGLQFAYASSAAPALQQGNGCAGDSTADPIGATFDQVYNGKLFYVVWNDQFYGDPMSNASSPAGHSKGVLAWNKDGNGVVMQVSTPSWPASGNKKSPRKTDGNTLGCVKDNDVLVSQHFFALKLTKDDVVAVLNGLRTANVVTNPAKPQIVSNGGPPDIQALVKGLGTNSKAATATKTTLSTGVVLLSKPAALAVPPWQMVSALLGGEPLRAATWWTQPEIPSTDDSTAIDCWSPSLPKPGAVDIATSGTWMGKTIGFLGMVDPDGNHAKVGVSTGTHPYVIFGDMNQDGALSGPKCASAQNGRGGMFYVVENQALFGSVKDLLQGTSAPK